MRLIYLSRGKLSFYKRRANQYAIRLSGVTQSPALFFRRTMIPPFQKEGSSGETKMRSTRPQDKASQKPAIGYRISGIENPKNNLGETCWRRRHLHDPCFEEASVRRVTPRH
jgi:hypothetical protein